MGKTVTPVYEKKRPGNILHSFANIDLIEKYINVKSIISFIDGLKITVKQMMVDSSSL